MRTDVIPMADKAGLRLGETVNVLLFGEGGSASFRTLTDVRVSNNRGKDWLLLEWEPGAATAWGTQSCGFAGYEIDEKLMARLAELAIEAALRERAS